jgi:DNA methylase
MKIPDFDPEQTRIFTGDCRAILSTMPEGSVQMVCTSPPYYGLRSYGIGTENGEIGLEQSPDEYVAQMVEVFRGVKRVLRDDGTVWLNLGDCYASGGKQQIGRNDEDASNIARRAAAYKTGAVKASTGGNIRRWGTKLDAKPKDLLMIPARVALALQADGWWLRSAIVWQKPNPLPESVKDRPTSSYEMVFMFAKSARYYFDQDAVREPHNSSYSVDAIRKAGQAGGKRPAGNNFSKQARHDGEVGPCTRAERAALLNPNGRNLRNVWTITEPKARLRADIPPEKRAYVLAELAHRGLV